MKIQVKSFFKDKYNIGFLFMIVIGFAISLMARTDKYPDSDFRQLALYHTVVFTVLLVLLPFYYIKKDVRYALAIFIAIFALSTVIVHRADNMFNNIGGDYWYINALVNKYKYYSEWLIDSTIKDIPSYLSPLYFFITGKMAWLFNISSSDALMFTTYIGVVAMPLLYYYLIKDSFDIFVVVLTIIIGCVFYHYELIPKPYQSNSALLALIFYYKFLPNVNRSSIRFNIKVILFGIVLFLLYYYHFVYLALAFFIDLLFRQAIDKKEGKEIVISRLAVYFGIFIVGFLLFLLPGILSVIKAGSSHKIFYGSTDRLEIRYLAFPLILGMFDILRNLGRTYAFRSLVMVSALTLLFVLNLFIEIHFKYNIHIFKIYHLIPIVILPHAIKFVYEFALQQIEAKYEAFAKMVILTLMLFFCINHWTTETFIDKKYTNGACPHFKNGGELIENTLKAVDLRNKVIFFPDISSRPEFGALIPNFRFLPINNDYGSPGSRIKERIGVMKQLDSVKSNPAAFAYILMNNKIDKVDYFYCNDNDNKLKWINISRLGDKNYAWEERPWSKSSLSERYFEKVNPLYPNLYRLKHEKNFINKSPDSLLFLEKVALGRINKNFYQSLMEDLTKNKSRYVYADILEAIYYLKSAENISEVQIDSLFSLAPKENRGFTFEAEGLKSAISGVEVNYADPNASGNYCRKIALPAHGMQGNVLFYGPYAPMYKGKYVLKLFLKANKKSDETVLNFDIGSAKFGRFASGLVTAKEIYSTDDFKTILLPFEITQTVEDLEIVGFYNASTNIELAVDKYEIIPY